MAAPKKPTQQIALIDPNKVADTFATELAGIGLGDMLHLTFAVVRPVHASAGVNTAQAERVVVARIAMPASALAGLIDQFQQLQTAVAVGQSLGGKPN